MLSFFGIHSTLMKILSWYVNLFAFESKFIRICEKSVGSSWTHFGTAGSTVTLMEFPWFWTFDRLARTTRQTSLRICTGRKTISNCSACIFPAKRILLIWLSNNSPLAAARSTISRLASSRSSLYWRIWIEPSALFRGFRISWDIELMNSFWLSRASSYFSIILCRTPIIFVTKN